MKKILLVVAFLFSISILTNGQTTRRGALSTPDQSLVKITDYATYDTATDLSGKDTTYIMPGGKLKNRENARVTNYLYVGSAGDTLYSSHCITLKDTTVSGVAYLDDYNYVGDKLIISWKTNGVGTKDTLFFYGNIQCDTTGSGVNNALYIKKDDKFNSHWAEFIWDGTKYQQVGTFRSAGNFIGR